MNKQYKHIFFDLDRTLWHFDENSKKVLRDMFDHFDLSKAIPNAVEFVNCYQDINEALWDKYREGEITKDDLRWQRFAQTLDLYNINDASLGKKMGDYYVHHSPRQTELLPHALEVLNYLDKKYTLHIITNGFEEVQHIKMKESAINHYFDVIVLSEKVGVKKPHPYIFKKSLQLSGAHVSESIMIGDDLYADIHGAQRVGMDHIYFNFYKLKHEQEVQQEINCLSELFEIL